ncbi:GNAT family N-acetyltransferase [Metabacillus arenae]|uniref:GNAT family N-acetyltransferase n=1 Tax=Metabacillus arenae TaxID=2771434 RepID=A0A926NMF8_9BACI|nr:GNAT family N-acetyltransferase [Metabacillus arenae]MBD1383323.1 GNAT family N-acetyltransferase [Metabacillus arenae]
MANYKIRPGTEQDINFLWEMLYQAIFVPEGEERPSREVLNDTKIKMYLDGWGKEGDIAFIAADSSENSVGAIWMRQFNDTTKTYGYIDQNTPVISGLAVLPQYRGQGIGTLLMNRLINKARDAGYLSLSLSVDPANPAMNLYEKKGFVKAGIAGTSWDMKATLNI